MLKLNQDTILNPKLSRPPKAKYINIAEYMTVNKNILELFAQIAVYIIIILTLFPLFFMLHYILINLLIYYKLQIRNKYQIYNNEIPCILSNIK